jgi:hypothetical protein
MRTTLIRSMPIDGHPERGRRYGQLVITDVYAGADSRLYAQCACGCQRVARVRLDRLRGGKTRSCGHLRVNRARGADGRFAA